LEHLEVLLATTNFAQLKSSKDQARLHQVLVDSPKVRKIYLNELEYVTDLPLGVAVVKLIVEPKETAAEQARQLIQRSQQESIPEASQQALIDLIETIIIYKFTSLSWEEIHVMLGLDDLKQSRAYRETLEEGRQEGRQEGQREIIENLLKVRFGELDENLSAVVEAVLGLSSAEFTPLLIQLSREELIDRFIQK
jgi:predicted transposase/invertase (TIGR01784 family)